MNELCFFRINLFRFSILKRRKTAEPVVRIDEYSRNKTMLSISNFWLGTQYLYYINLLYIIFYIVLTSRRYPNKYDFGQNK